MQGSKVGLAGRSFGSEALHLGTVHDVIGNILQDEKLPGMHIAFGHPYGDHTGAQWTSKTHIDVVGRKFDIWLDDIQIMRAGEFLVTA